MHKVAPISGYVPSDYRNDPKFSDRYACANSADADQTDQGLHCLPFRLHLLDSMEEPHCPISESLQQFVRVSEYLGFLR